MATEQIEKRLKALERKICCANKELQTIESGTYYIFYNR